MTGPRRDNKYRTQGREAAKFAFLSWVTGRFLAVPIGNVVLVLTALVMLVDYLSSRLRKLAV
jgi:hypothetical protein